MGIEASSGPIIQRKSPTTSKLTGEARKRLIELEMQDKSPLSFVVWLVVSAIAWNVSPSFGRLFIYENYRSSFLKRE